ncbi:flagellar hook-length control protein FliK [Iodobacter fluviatilis]|uniref:Flagellar hook-length control protein FliK n=1 Tax=Iodobacter fluviatilis TaxID=537 RepID=A0A377SU88_9NEIS|nr:flagellar hook-length control protein FliK [Iodobacter fluviatilis]TCU86126.1 flagellar hook-length control protein FliK [Iodobacter fluviatilis]STR44537.1 type III secretion system needle length determinant [Iodobacter fluviatilis]
MNLLASMMPHPADLNLPAINTPPLDPLLAMLFSGEMQDCATPVAESEAVATKDEKDISEQPTDVALLSMPAFFAPIIPKIPGPQISAAEADMIAEPFIAPQQPVVVSSPPLTISHQEADAPLLKAEPVLANDAPDQPAAIRPFELNTMAAGSMPQAKPSEWAPIKLEPTQPASWSRHLETALKDRLDVQLGHGIERAVIKLSPPMLGSLEISIKHEAGALSVQLHASNSDVTKQLHAITEQMRTDLSQKEYSSVAVDVRDPSASKDGSPKKQAAESDEVGQALAELGEETSEFGSILARI